MSLMPQTMLVCLCGTPVAPQLGGIRGGRTPNVEMVQFLRSLDQVKEAMASQHRDVVKEEAAKVSVLRRSVKAFGTALARVERALERMQACKTSKGKPPRGQTWQLPRRQVPKRIGRDSLALELQKSLFRSARRGRW